MISAGQHRTLLGLERIASHHSGAVDLISHDCKDDGWVRAVVRLDCTGIPQADRGLRLRDRERFTVLFPPDFPFKVPSVFVQHTRFAGSAHVQWKICLCLYQSPATEWVPSGGVFGFFDRLWDWIRKGAIGELDPVGGPLHPPAVYAGSSSKFVVTKVDAPEIGEQTWFGFAELQQVTDNRADIIGWHSWRNAPKDRRLAATLLLPTRFPFEYPGTGSRLLDEIHSATSDSSAFLDLLGFVALHNPDGSPLHVIVGTAMRGVRGATELQQHLAVWHLNAVATTALALSLKKHRTSADQIRLGELARAAFLEWATGAKIEWCTVLENRPQIVTRRDAGSPLSWFYGKSVALWGCGAIGGNVAESLVRAGAKRIVLRDNGIVKPGVLSRQPFSEADIGLAKAEALKNRLHAIDPEVTIEAHSGDVLGHLDSSDWTEDVDVILDATANASVLDKLELVRRLRETTPPIVSMAVSAKAEWGLVLTCPSKYSGGPSDASRKMKLELCRRSHLSSLAETFWPVGALDVFQPEPGCSESTFVGSNADLETLSGGMLNLAAQDLDRTDPSTATGHLIPQPHLRSHHSVVSFSWKPDSVLHDAQKGVDIRISADAMNELIAWENQSERTRGRDVETGGVLFGQKNEAIGVVWIDELIGPPPDSEASEDGFICGTKGVKAAEEQKSKRYRGSVAFIGMWHTHPRSRPLPSSTDYAGMRDLVLSRDPAPASSVMLIVGGDLRSPELGAYLFEPTDFAPNAPLFRKLASPLRYDPPARPESIGLALSGGGARAIAFHLGTLRALHDRGVLDRLEVISAVSGGSVIAALYAYSEGDFADFDRTTVGLLRNGLVRDVVLQSIAPANLLGSVATMLTAGLAAAGSAVFRPMFGALARLIGVERRVPILSIQPPFRRFRSRTIGFEKALDRLFGGQTLVSARRDNVHVVLNATELSTMSAFRFGSRESGCWRLGSLVDNAVPVSTAVAASAAYPAFLPCLDKEYEFQDKNGKLSRKRAILTDGGVYENLGVGNLEPDGSRDFGFNVFEPDFIIASAAGPGIPGDEVKPYWWPSRMMRSFESVHRKSQDGVLKRLHGYVPAGKLRGFVLPYLGQIDKRLPWAPPDLVAREDVVDYPTDFSPMTSTDIERISLRGEQLTRLLLDHYCPNL